MAEMTGPKRLLVALLALTALGGCSEREEREGAQPAPDVTSFEQGRFDNLLLAPRSDPVGPRSEQEGVVSRSFTAKGTTPEQVLRFYEQNLTGWRQVEPVHEVGTSSWRGTWEQGQWRLEVSAGRAPALDDPLEAQAQYSLVLRPR